MKFFYKAFQFLTFSPQSSFTNFTGLFNHSDEVFLESLADNFAFLALKEEFFLSEEENFLFLFSLKFFNLDSFVIPSLLMAVLANFRLSCRLAFFILSIYSGTSPPDLFTSIATFLKSVLSSSVKKVIASPDLPARPVLPILVRKIQKIDILLKTM